MFQSINNNYPSSTVEQDISYNAGSIYYLLEKEKRMSITDITQITCYTEKIVLLALGWLTRDNRIKISYINGNLLIELNVSPMTEILY